MKNITTKIIAAALALVICLSFTACTSSNDNLNMTNLHECIAKTEKETLEFIGVDSDDIESRNEPAPDNVDIILSKTFNFKGKQAMVILMFYKDYFLGARYIFTDDEIAGFKYAKEIKEQFDKVYEIPQGYYHYENVEELTEEEYKNTSPEDNATWRNDWLMEDRNGVREQIARDAQRETDLAIAVSLIKSDGSSSVSVGISACKITDD